MATTKTTPKKTEVAEKKVTATKKPATTPKKVVKKAVKKTEVDMSKDYAIFETGGRQYGVQVGDTIKIEKLIGSYEEGSSVTFDKVLFVDNGADTTIGDPYIKGASIVCDIKSIARARKVSVVKYKAKSRYFKRNGHRQPFFELTITAIK